VADLNGHLSSVESVSFSPDRKFLFSGERNGRIIIWQANGMMLRSFLAHRSLVSSVVFVLIAKRSLPLVGIIGLDFWNLVEWKF
jgi:WD40 repeat protein